MSSKVLAFPYRRLFLVCAASAVAMVALAASTANPARAARAGNDSFNAVFVQTNDTSGNQVLAYSRDRNGLLSLSGTYATGGLGGVENGAVVDHLASQGSLTYDSRQKLLFAVNGGSNSLSVFAVKEHARLQRTEVIPSGGSFPSSVASNGRFVYVLNAGGGGSVSGFVIVGNFLLPLPFSTRSLNLGNTQPPFFLTAPGQVGFSPDGQQLIVTTKGSTNSIDVFGVGRNGELSASPTISPSAAGVPFGFVFSPSGRLVVAEAAGSNLTTYALNGNGTVTDPKPLPDGQAALCWVTAIGNDFYVANAGSNTISHYRSDSAGNLTLEGVVGNTETGAIDLIAASDGRDIYAESGGAGTVDEFGVSADGSLTRLGTITGLPIGLEGIAAT